jgi:L-alanine-DL-glutamate epimerase-like enolase superfamily enzyme
MLNLPFSCERQRRHMHRACTGGERLCIWRVETDAGLVGWGDGDSGPEPATNLVGKNLFDCLYRDSVGDGVQLALLDLAGKALDVPVHRLLGEKVRDAAPISWWAIDMPPEDWVEEVKLAISRGYTSIKLKARPWRDIIQQLDAVSKVVPDGFKCDIDFNGFMNNASNAIPVLRELDAFDHVAFYETPIWQHDVDGYRQIRSRVKRPIATHWGDPPVATALVENVCDGFILGGRVNEVRAWAAVAAAFNKPFWLQMWGTSIRTAYAVHLGAVLSHAQWPMVTCHCLWADDLLKTPLRIDNGYIRVSDEPGLGIDVDEEALGRYRVDPSARTPKEEYRAKRRVIIVRWPPAAGQKKGPGWLFTDDTYTQNAFGGGTIAGFARGVTQQVVEDDGSPGFDRLYARVLAGDSQE